MTTTEKEKIYLLAITKSNYFDDGLSDKDQAVWCFSVTDEISEYTPQQAKGVMSSLVKKDLITIEDYEGKNRPDDMTVCMTQKGIEVLEQIRV